MKRRAVLLFAMVSALSFFLLSTWANAGQVESSGKWQTIDFEVKGEWKIVKESDGLYVVLDDQFETKDGPDLHILLSPKPVSELTNSNASQGSLKVGLLKSTDDSLLFKKVKGAQTLKIADGTDLQKYKSIVIHCVRYSHVWAAGNLR